MSAGKHGFHSLRRALITAGLLGGAMLAMSGALARAAPLPTLSLAITPGAIAVSATTESGAVNVVTKTAKGVKEPGALLVLIKPGVTVEEVLAFLAANKAGADANTVSRYGSIVFDGEARPGGTTEAQTSLAAGTYLALNAEGEKSSKWPHATFTVTASAAPVALPTPAAVEKTIDFAFKGPKTLRRGELVRFENEGYVVHMNVAFPAKTKKAAEKLARALLRGDQKGLEKLVAGPPVSFAGPLSTGSMQQETITAAPGWYVQACFMDTEDGRSHTLLGMERLIKITK